MIDQLIEFIAGKGFNLFTAALLVRSAAFLLAVLHAVAAFRLAEKLIRTFLPRFLKSTSTDWYDVMFRNRVFDSIAHFAPAVVLIIFAPFVFDGSDRLLAFVSAGIKVYMTFIFMLLIFRFTDTAFDIYQTYPVSREIPIKGFLQVLKIISVGAAFIVTIAILLNEEPLIILSGLGAISALLLLIFRDSILGFVAGIMLISNRMVVQGDWIEMPKYDADGDVIDVSLATVKVQNWDRTITTIPTYALISDSFKNWRGMTESGGRRIKRSIFIDMTTIKFLDEEMLQRFARIRFIKEYLNQKKMEITEYNTLAEADDTCLVNGRRLTNIGTFRAYITSYLRNHPKIRQDMTFLVRQLEPAEHGIPIEIYVFCSDQEWANYEAIQADIFDHILAVVPEFDLRVFQEPSGYDFRKALGR